MRLLKSSTPCASRPAVDAYEASSASFLRPVDLIKQNSGELEMEIAAVLPESAPFNLNQTRSEVTQREEELQPYFQHPCITFRLVPHSD